MKTFGDPSVRDVVRRRLESLSPASERKWGSMTVAQMLRHLDGAQSRLLDGGEFPPMRRQPTLVRIMALRTPMPWPKGVPTGADPTATEVPEEEFEAYRTRVLEGVGRFGAWTKTTDTPVHPAFGDLTPWEWQRWAYRHADHHLRQFSA